MKVNRIVRIIIAAILAAFHALVAVFARPARAEDPFDGTELAECRCRDDVVRQIWAEKACLLELEAEVDRSPTTTRHLGSPISQARRRLAQLDFELQGMDDLVGA